MKNKKLTKKTFNQFMDNIRKEDLEEIKYFYPKNTRKKYFKTIKKLKETYFIFSQDNTPLAIGGIKENAKNKQIGQVWLLCANEFKKEKFSLYKFIKNKIEIYKKKYQLLYNFIYITNFQAQSWLKPLGFRFVCTDNPNFKLFYMSNGDKKIDLRNSTSK